MTTRIQYIFNLLDAEFNGTYNGDYEQTGIKQMEFADIAVPRYFIRKPILNLNTGVNKSYTYQIELEASSEANLESMIDNFLNLTSANTGNGYEFSTSGYPIWINVQEVGFDYENINTFKTLLELEAIW